MRFIGGKSQLLQDIESIIGKHARGDEEVFCDIFAGTGSVALHFKHKYSVISNDILHFSYVIQKATIENNITPVFEGLAKIGIADPLKFLEETDIVKTKVPSFFITKNYSPSAVCDRMYITKSNAQRVDFIRNTIESWKNQGLVTELEYYYLLASLIEGVPFVSNITGTYGAYLKEWDKRALKPFEMVRLPVEDNGRENHSYNMDSNKLIREIEGDILYIDPPYNSRQYAPNYHLLETISRFDNPNIYGVTGMRPYEDLKSSFCVKSEVLDVFEDLIAKAKFSTIVMSYSTDGLMTSDQIEKVLRRHCVENSYKLYVIPYRKYKSKIANETKTLKEYIFSARKNIPKAKTFPVSSKRSKLSFSPVISFKYLKSPLNYIGGKYKLLPQILPLFPRQISTFVDLFAGGCNVGINVSAERVICNDLNDIIIDMYKTFQLTETKEILRRIEQNIRKFKLSKDNEQGFINFREHYNKTPDPIDLYTLACYSFNYQFRFNNNHEYNNPFGRNRSQFSENMRNNLLLFLEHIKNNNIEFTSIDFTKFDMSSLGHEDMVYCDPPYLITTGSYNDGNRGFKDWKSSEDIALYKTLDKLNSQGVKFALSNVLKHKGVQNKILLDWCKKYKVAQLDMDYSNSSYNTKCGESAEVLITNY
jgi:adenine-specific DNA-methyltransferase